MNTIAKEERLRELFRELESVIVAYSGGVDSSYVAYVANEELRSRAVCITGQSASLPVYQRAEIDRVVEKVWFSARTDRYGRAGEIRLIAQTIRIDVSL
jgi:uncharacterized protein